VGDRIGVRGAWFTVAGLWAGGTNIANGMAVEEHDHPHLPLDGTMWWFCSTA
jgi:hypothetical protein